MDYLFIIFLVFGKSFKIPWKNGDLLRFPQESRIWLHLGNSQQDVHEISGIHSESTKWRDFSNYQICWSINVFKSLLKHNFDLSRAKTIWELLHLVEKQIRFEIAALYHSPIRKSVIWWLNSTKVLMMINFDVGNFVNFESLVNEILRALRLETLWIAAFCVKL